MTRVERWEKHAEVPLLLLALAFLVAYAVPIVDTHLHRGPRNFLATVSWTVWGAFFADFAGRLWLSEDRVRYARQHWYDVALIALPMLRPLRLIRVLALARVLNRSAATSLISKVTTYTAGIAVAAVGLGAISVLDAEQHAKGANITTIGGALWWASTTVATVGYGDRYPVTAQGRLIAIVLMLVGIGVVGATTASVATWMIAQVRRNEQERADAS